MKLLNKKGMTLFELLAVIVILGIIAAIAFPTVNGLIENSRQDSFASSVNNFVTAAKTDAQSDAVATNTEVSITYSIVSGAVQKDGSAYTGLGFDATGFTTGSITIVANPDGTTTISLTEDFANATHTTDLIDTTTTSYTITGALTREDVIEV